MVFATNGTDSHRFMMEWHDGGSSSVYVVAKNRKLMSNSSLSRLFFSSHLLLSRGCTPGQTRTP